MPLPQVVIMQLLLLLYAASLAEVLLHELKLELLRQVLTAAVFGCYCILLMPHGSLW